MSDPSVPDHAPTGKNNPGQGRKDPSVPDHAPPDHNRPGSSHPDHSVPEHAPKGGIGSSDKKKEQGVPTSAAEASIPDHAPEPKANPGHKPRDESVPDHAPGGQQQQQTPEANPDRTRLRDHFASGPTDSSRWDKLWTQGYAPWDRGLPNPALVDLLASRPSSLPSLTRSDGKGSQRPKALVPGCGKGYDVFLLASWGFDARGLEISGEAANQARAEGKRIDSAFEQGEPNAYDTKDTARGRGSWEILEGDFFDDSWAGRGFDLIYDYTFFCALPPQLRPRWAARMAKLLTPDGRLVCLEFPTYKDPSLGGPPWAVRPKEYVAYLSRPGETVRYGADGFVTDVDEEDPLRSSTGLVRIAHFQPERTHEIGKGTDWIAIWRHQ